MGCFAPPPPPRTRCLLEHVDGRDQGAARARTALVCRHVPDYSICGAPKRVCHASIRLWNCRCHPPVIRMHVVGAAAAVRPAVLIVKTVVWIIPPHRDAVANLINDNVGVGHNCIRQRRFCPGLCVVAESQTKPFACTWVASCEYVSMWQPKHPCIYIYVYILQSIYIEKGKVRCMYIAYVCRSLWCDVLGAIEKCANLSLSHAKRFRTCPPSSCVAGSVPTAHRE